MTEAESEAPHPVAKVEKGSSTTKESHRLGCLTKTQNHPTMLGPITTTSVACLGPEGENQDPSMTAHARQAHTLSASGTTKEKETHRHLLRGTNLGTTLKARDMRKVWANSRVKAKAKAIPLIREKENPWTKAKTTQREPIIREAAVRANAIRTTTQRVLLHHGHRRIGTC